MKINELLKQKTTLSFEVFPPKNKNGDITFIYQTIEGLAHLKPDFISVTYGAGGSTIGKTIEIANTIKSQYGIEAVAHLTCISSSKQDVLSFCDELKKANVENILALRGDVPMDETDANLPNDFAYAKDLISFIKENYKDDFCISGACYPEVHQEADCFENDLKALKEKVDAGASYLITQICFDNNYFYRLVKEARKIGIDVPILAGVMPILNSKQLLKTAKLCGCSIPYQLSTMIETYYNHPDAMMEIGINYATHQIIDLIANGVDGIHIYTMNKPEIANRIFDNIPTVLKAFQHHD